MSVDAELHFALRSLSETYALAADRRDPDLFVSVFTPDARLLVFRPPDHARPAAVLSAHAELSEVPGRLAGYERTFHLLGNCRYELLDADQAAGTVYCVANHITAGADGRVNYSMHIRYLDQYAQRPGGVWLMTERRVVVDFTETRPVDPPA